MIFPWTWLRVTIFTHEVCWLQLTSCRRWIQRSPGFTNSLESTSLGSSARLVHNQIGSQSQSLASQPRVFNNSYFRVVFQYRPSPFLKGISLLLNNTHNSQSIFNNELTDWRFFIVIISRTNALEIRSGLFQIRVYRKYDLPSCGEEDCETFQWFTNCNRIKLNGTNILTTSSFQLHVHEYKRTQKSKCASNTQNP